MEDKGTSGATVVEPAANTASTKKAIAKKPKSSSSKTAQPKPSHPSTPEMVNAAIKELKDRKGSSMQAIKKYIVTTYKVDGDKFAPFIKRYLKSALTAGTVVQTKGKGASGSFKLAAVSKTATKPKSKGKPAKKSVEKKTVARKTEVKKTAAKKKVAAEKKTAVKKAAAKPAAPKVKPPTKKEAKPSALSKTKKITKAPAATKPKTPKPKKASAKPAKAAAKK